MGLNFVLLFFNSCCDFTVSIGYCFKSINQLDHELIKTLIPFLYSCQIVDNNKKCTRYGLRDYILTEPLRTAESYNQNNFYST